MNRTKRRCAKLLLIGATLGSGLGAAAQKDEPATPRALLITIDREIDGGTVALVNRGVREALDRGVRHLILDINSPGGRLDSMQSVHEELRALRTGDVDTVAFVDQHAISAAAMIAISCSRLYMREAASIGAITPIEFNPLTGEVSNIASDARGKLISSVQKMLHAAIEGSPRDTRRNRLLLDAMVDPAIELYRVTYRQGVILNDAVLVDRTQLEQLRANPDVKIEGIPAEIRARPLVLTAKEAVEFGLAEGVVSSINDVAERLGIDWSEVGRLRKTWADEFVELVNQMRMVLFVLGFILLLIELKTPGFALPGILGVMMFGLAFFGAYMVGLANIGEILLFFLGLGLLAAEIFFFPGTIVFGVAGFVCIVSGLILAQQSFVIPGDQQEADVLLGNIANFGWVLLVVMVGTWLVYSNIHRIPILRAAVQTPPEPHAAGRGTADSHQERLQKLVGVTGELVCDLRPTGWMEIGGERFDVVSQGRFIDRGTRVRVIEVRGNRVVVEEIEDPARGREGESGEVHAGWLILLVLVGFALVIAEVFFVSFGVLAVLSGVCLVSAVFCGFAYYGSGVGFLILTICAVGVPLLIKMAFRWLPHTAFGRHLYLEGLKHEEVTGSAQQEGLQSFLDKSGVALCDLRPSGYAQIDGRRVDVVTRGEMLAKDTPLRVIKIESNQVFVARAPQE